MESPEALKGALHDALLDSAADLQTKAPVAGHDRRMTLAIVAGTCFVLGFLWAKARAHAR